jgi:hypothetical protein
LSPEDNDRVQAFFSRQRESGLGEIQTLVEQKFAEDFKNEGAVPDAETSQFFVCRNLFCDGAYCLRCEIFLKKEDMQSHFCRLDEADKLYFRIIDTLAESSTMKCPSCGTSGKKDLACTHITCDKCSGRFCYMCGIAESALEGGFQEHNQWTLSTPADQKRCPMYVQYKYGDMVNGDLKDGDPGTALESFHLELQTKAIEALKKEVNNNALWSRVEKERFKGHILPPPYVPPFKIRYKKTAEKILKAWIGSTIILYFLMWIGEYIYMLYEGIANFTASVCIFIQETSTYFYF